MVFIQPTDKEKESITKLKISLNEENIQHSFTDTALLRFLRGRKGDEEKAYRALVKHCQWRIENKVDEITTDHIPNEIAAGKINIYGKDKDGCPIFVVTARNHNKDNRCINEIKLFIIHSLEEAVKASDPLTEQVAIVFDLDQFGYACMDYEVVKLLINILEFNYPETLHTALIVSAPMIFSACWMVIKPWLDPVTAAKCTFVYKTDLNKYIDESQIPPQFL